MCKGFSSGQNMSGLCTGCFSSPGKSPEHKTDHGNVDPGLFTGGEHFIVFGQAPPGREPGESSLHNPSPFEHMKATGADLLPINDRILWRPDAAQAAPGMLDDFYCPAQRLLDPRHKAAFVVGTIRPDECESWKAAWQGLQEVSAPCMILDVGFVDQHVQDQPIGIDEQVPFTALDPLATIVTAKPPF